ncbi:MAG: methyltransferase domain-containing protein [Phycisphaeraceae bacterium]|nr:methyltransferase domain-containing protein [Phycisphaeraceae bacterium]
MTEQVTGQVYDLWARFYDYSFGSLVRRRQRAAVQQLRLQPGDRVLDLGVGTGMTFAHYPKNVSVVGIDLSAGMLHKAAQKINKHHFDHCTLVQGDAMRPPFADHSFDHVMITHVISVVSDPRKLMYWAQRLVKPGGRIVVLNHFLAGNPLVAMIERALNPLFVHIGWRSDLSMDECLRGQDLNLHVQYRFKLAAIDLWQIVVLSDQPASRTQTELSRRRKLPGGVAVERG